MYSGDEFYGDDVTSGPATDPTVPGGHWMEVRANHPGFSLAEIVDEHAGDFEKDEDRRPSAAELADRLDDLAHQDPGTYLAARLVEAADALRSGETFGVDLAGAPDSPEVVLGDHLTEAIDATLEAFELLVRAVREANGTGMLDHFVAYHMADLEGEDAGWLGRSHLVDVLRKMRQGEF